MKMRKGMLEAEEIGPTRESRNTQSNGIKFRVLLTTDDTEQLELAIAEHHPVHRQFIV
jgi:hypothetical protein